MHADHALRERFVAAELARADLYFFARYLFQRQRGYQWKRAAHHRVICDALMRVIRGECQRLIINIPPRYSKTHLAVLSFIGWAMGHYPDAEFLHASYSTTLAVNNSAAIRALLQHEAYRDVFPAIALADDSRARDHWKTHQGGVMYATGAGGTITGFGAGKDRPEFGGAIVIDDPHKADEARSDVVRQGVIDWFQNTLESRQNAPGRTPIVLVMQRLHEEDLSGWLLNGGNGEQWDHICLPAITDAGEALWPEKHAIEDLRRMEQASPYVFAGQYLQRPAPPEGGIFKPDQIRIIDALPAVPTEWMRGWDLAASTGGDWTAGGKIGKLKDGRFVIGDMVRLRAGPDDRDAAILNTASRDGGRVKVSLPQDPGQAGKTQVLHLSRMLAGYPVHTSPETGDKVTRAEPFASQVNVGNVMMVRGPWNADLINEMRLFPNGRADDQVDALSRAFAGLLGAVDASPAGMRVAGL